MKIYKTVAVNSFNWNGKTYNPGDEFEGSDNDCRRLIGAGVIGAKLEIVDDERKEEIETADTEPPENAARRTSRKRK